MTTGDHSTNDRPVESTDKAVEAAQAALYCAYVVARNEMVRYYPRTTTKDKSHEAGGVFASTQAFLESWSIVSQANLKLALDVQDSTLQTTRILFDTAMLAQRNWIDQVAGAAEIGQGTVAKFTHPNLDLLRFTLPGSRT